MKYLLSMLVFVASLAHGFEPKAQPFRNPGVSAPSASRFAGAAGAGQGGEVVSDGSLSGRMLRGIILSGDQSMANVDGELVRLGQRLDGWRLRKLTDTTATFVRHHEKQVLYLQRAGVKAESGANPAATGAPVPVMMPGAMGVPGELQVPQGQGAAPVVSLPPGSTGQPPMQQQSLPVVPPELLKLMGQKN